LIANQFAFSNTSMISARVFVFLGLAFAIAKSTNITERIKFRFAFDFFNLTNHVDFANPAPSLTAPTSFGVITAQLVPVNRAVGSRSIQVS
jgi:hypothetical protein